MLRPSIEAMVETMEAKGYRVYDTPQVDWNLNIVGIRSAATTAGAFDDTLAVFQRFGGSWEISYYDVTTDPGRFYLEQPVNALGAAILKEGQYRGAYELGLHARGRRSAHLALCQRLAPVTVYRDADRDHRLDLDRLQTETGMFGINIHRGNGSYADPQNVAYSAGCQVFADPRKFAEFVAKCREGARVFGNKFTYTLLHERDFG
ncbi:MAG: hypothetical protein HY899_00265 [Deltaproteobacteria bacterium]|nr:hypothetical protein [Deltaproteobacteria bacterium]